MFLRSLLFNNLNNECKDKGFLTKSQKIKSKIRPSKIFILTGKRK